MKKVTVFTLFLFFIFLSVNLYAQTNVIAGAPNNAVSPVKYLTPQNHAQSKFVSSHIQAIDSFETTVYTFSDLIIFSYFDDTQIKIYDYSYNLLESFTMSADTVHKSSFYAGVYHVVGSKSFTVLIGDPIANYINGYFAVDQAGRGVSTRLNTWMMRSYGYSSDFIVFAYEDNTGFTVRNLETGDLIAAGNLNAGEHYSFANTVGIPENVPLQVLGTKPVSALSYSDQDYYIPSANGYFTGNLFYGYSGYVGAWANSITVISYSDNNDVVVTNSVTGDTLETYTLMAGQVHPYNVYDITYWKVESSGKCAVANIPFGVWSGNYAYMTRAIDENGSGAGKHFYLPTCQSTVSVFSFAPNNVVKIKKLGLYTEYPYAGSSVIYEDTLQAGEYYEFTTDYGSIVYEIESSGNVSAVQSYFGWGADFMPLSYALQLPDLTSSTSDIDFSVPDSVYVAGDTMTVSLTIHNVGSADAAGIDIMAFDGDPDLGGIAPPIAKGFIEFIGAGNSDKFSFKYRVPNNPEFRSIVFKIDPFNVVVESNKSNNKAQRFLRSNRDLLPPLSITVTAPSNLLIDTLTGEIAPNPFPVRFDIFNTGNVTATDVQVQLDLFNGLTLPSGLNIVYIGGIAANGTANVEFYVQANKDSSGFNLYQGKVTASNAETKIVSRAINVPDIIPPQAPQNPTATLTETKCVLISWDAVDDKDVAGYYVYYSTDQNSWDGTGAANGNSPLIVYGNNSILICELPLTNNENTQYYFMVKAFDTSLNLSKESQIVSATVTDVESENEIPTQYSLSQNYPNPFNPSTVIRYSLPFEGNVKISVFNSLGQVIDVLVNKSQSIGNYEVQWSAKYLSSGIYFYTIEAISADNKHNFRDVKKMIFMK